MPTSAFAILHNTAVMFAGSVLSMLVLPTLASHAVSVTSVCGMLLNTTVVPVWVPDGWHLITSLIRVLRQRQQAVTSTLSNGL
jgi:hypothetical protein